MPWDPRQTAAQRRWKRGRLRDSHAPKPSPVHGAPTGMLYVHVILRGANPPVEDAVKVFSTLDEQIKSCESWKNMSGNVEILITLFRHWDEDAVNAVALKVQQELQHLPGISSDPQLEAVKIRRTGDIA